MLSDEEVGLLAVYQGLHHVEIPLLAEFIRHIEAAILAEQGKLAEQAKAGPVAWIDAGDLREIGNGNSRYCHPDDQGRMVPLYAAPVVQPCEHYFVMDEEAVRHKCCQKCGLIAAAEKEAGKC